MDPETQVALSKITDALGKVAHQFETIEEILTIFNKRIEALEEVVSELSRLDSQLPQ